MNLVVCPDCERIYPDAAAFRALPLEDALSFEDGQRLETRRCECGTELGIWTDRDGNPAPGNVHEAVTAEIPIQGDE